MSGVAGKNFSLVRRDFNFHTVKTSRRTKIPHYATLSSITVGAGNEADLVLNRSNRVFYGHNGNMWVPLSSVSGTYDDGFQATDAAGVIIDDNAAAGIITGFSAVAGGSTAVSSGTNSVAIGANSTATSNGAVAVGQGSDASGINAISMGRGPIASGANSVALGSNSIAIADTATAVGQAAAAQATNTVAVGRAAFATAAGAIALGAGAAAGTGAAAPAQLGLPTSVTIAGTVVDSPPSSLAIEVNIGGTAYFIPLYNSVV